MNKNRLMTTSLSFFILSTIAPNEGLSSVLEEEKAISETSSCRLHYAAPSQSRIHTFSFFDLIQALKAPLDSPLQKRIMPASLLKAACLDLGMLRDLNAISNEDGKELFRQAVFNGLMGLKIFYEVARGIPDEASSFFEALKAARIDDEEKKDLTEISAKDQSVEALIKRMFISFFLKIPGEKRQNITVTILNALVTDFKKKIEQNFGLEASQQIFDMLKLGRNPELVEFVLSFGIPRRMMTNTIGLHLIYQKQNALAEQWYRRAAEEDHPEVMYLLGFLLYEQGNKKEAEVWLRKAAEKEHLSAIASLGALLAEEDNKKKEAEVWLRKAVKKGHPQATYNLGFLLNEQGREEEAKGFFEQAAAKGIPEATHNLGILLSKQGKKKKAEECFRKVANEGFPEAMYNLALLLNEQKKKEEAEAWFIRAAEKEHPEAMYNLGVLLYKKGKEEGALNWYIRAAGKGIPDAMLNLGAIFAEQGNKKEAKKWYRRAAAEELPEAMYNLGLIFDEEGNKEEAEKCYRMAADRGFREAMHNLGFLLYEQGKKEEAEACFERAAQQSHPAAMANLGLLLYEQKNEEGAKKWFRSAADKGELGAMHNLAVLLAAQGNKEEAKKWYTKAAKKGFCKDLINVALMLPDTHPDKPKLYQEAIKLGVKDAEIFYADFLERQGNIKKASEFLDFYDAQQDRASSSDEDSNEKRSSLVFEDSTKEALKRAEEKPIASSSTNEVSTMEEISEKEERTRLSKRLQKLCERQKRQAEKEALEMISASNLRRSETPKSYEDVSVFAPPKLHEEIKNNEMIQGLISCLANGEGSRAHLEQLETEKNLFSMRLTKQDRFVFQILEGDMKNGIKSLRIASVKGHYKHLEERASATGKIEKVVWEKSQ